MNSGAAASTLADMRAVTVPRHQSENGELLVVEGTTHVPFPIARVFIVRAGGGAVRGQHAHKACTQFLVCVAGEVSLRCDDGAAVRSVMLDPNADGLLVPPGIWMEQTYLGDEAVLVVFCDRPYEADDYIRDYPAFTRYRRQEGGARD